MSVAGMIDRFPPADSTAEWIFRSHYFTATCDNLLSDVRVELSKTYKSGGGGSQALGARRQSGGREAQAGGPSICSWPSWMRHTRSACRAISLLWVAMTKVLPASRVSRSKS